MSAPPRPAHLPLMLALTFSAGVVDAIGFLGLDRVFTANMTGNIVILGMGLAQADGLPVLGPALALAGFLAGATVAGRVQRQNPAGWTVQSSAIFTSVATLLAITATWLLIAPGYDEIGAATITGSLGIAMGLQAATARQLAVKDVTTVVVTSTITGLAADSSLGNRRGAPHARRRIAAVLFMLAGAATGALLLQLHLGVGLAAAALLTAAVTIIGEVERRRSIPPKGAP
ncbi:DUF1275 family protein [Aeromicrobium sp. PE09-221]|uniref:YoaK family protein n=1 Tax=Aeromicrobium sp. PE09-221 TaxID=1898043 RepID=UPI000B3EBE3C|nr:YoaK family protein [Aeromicrobium sp. PE09-221]OUZ11940.1 DUF1275 family protein [Aeromicrobium sp. PE09-221]